MLKKGLGRYLALLTACVVLLGSLSGCAGSEKPKLDANNPTTIVVWHYYHGAQKTAFDDAVREFNESLGYKTGIIVEAISHGGVTELAENVMAAAKGELDAGEMPDVFGSYGDTALDILNMGLVAEIDNYLSPEELSQYEDSFIHEGRLGTNELYVFPIAKSSESLMLNKTDFDAFAAGLKSVGISETVGYDDLATWEGILRVADIYYLYTQSISPDHVGKAFMGIDAPANYLIVGSKQLGQDLVKAENGRASFNFDRDIMSKLWYTYYEPMVTGRFVKLGRFCSDDVKTGDSLCYIGSTSSASYFPTEILTGNSARDIELMVLPMPVFEGGDKVAISQGAGMAVAKSGDVKKEYASALFLKWFTESERNVSFALNASYLPVKKDALDDAVLSRAFGAIDDGNAAAQNSVKALKVGVEQLRSYALYSCDVFDGGADFRQRLPEALVNSASEDRNLYMEAVADGKDPEQVYSELLEQSLEKFELWLNSLIQIRNIYGQKQ